jgi:hypothetical protein
LEMYLSRAMMLHFSYIRAYPLHLIAGMVRYDLRQTVQSTCLLVLCNHTPGTVIGPSSRCLAKGKRVLFLTVHRCWQKHAVHSTLQPSFLHVCHQSAKFQLQSAVCGSPEDFCCQPISIHLSLPLFLRNIRPDPSV